MTESRRGYDWGARAPRWAGVRSGTVELGALSAHYLRAEGPGGASPQPVPHLLIHPMATGSWMWMDLIRPLSALGPVIAPDLPGAGRSRPVDRGAGTADAGARFLVEFTQALGLPRVVIHGSSMGALVAARFAALVPERVERVVLTSPALPGRPDPPRFPALWRAALAAAPTVARVPMYVAIRMRARGWRRWRRDPSQQGPARELSRMGTDAARVSPELLRLIADELERSHVGWRVDAALSAAVSAFSAFTIDQDTVRAALDGITAPTLLLWGTADRVIPGALMDELVATHPAWTYRTLEGLGHMLPWEAPQAYVDLVEAWAAVR